MPIKTPIERCQGVLTIAGQGVMPPFSHRESRIVQCLAQFRDGKAGVGDWEKAIASSQEHAVAVAEEAVLLLNGMAIGGKDCFAPREGADQHEQARLGQVEIR